MTTKFIGNRGSGKTQAIIDECRKHETSIILVRDSFTKDNILHRLTDVDKMHISVCTFAEWVKTNIGRGLRNDSIFVDEAEDFMRYYLHLNNVDCRLEGYSIDHTSDIELNSLNAESYNPMLMSLREQNPIKDYLKEE